MLPIPIGDLAGQHSAQRHGQKNGIASYLFGQCRAISAAILHSHLLDQLQSNLLDQ